MPPAVKYKMANTIDKRDELAKVLIKLINATNGAKVTMRIKILKLHGQRHQQVSSDRETRAPPMSLPM